MRAILNANNKIAITDGKCFFPENRPYILWIVLNYWLPYYLNPKYNPNVVSQIGNINYVFINEKDIEVPNKKSLLKK